MSVADLAVYFGSGDDLGYYGGDFVNDEGYGDYFLPGNFVADADVLAEVLGSGVVRYVVIYVCVREVA